ncbi:MAG: hypothetical protein Q4A78_03680 [Peptostreptococcaceae bacterium]|nr:hypothetical protein [Peptostreptococcaceae bacterium]
MKKVYLFLIIGILITSLAACSPPKNEPAGGTETKTAADLKKEKETDSNETTETDENTEETEEEKNVEGGTESFFPSYPEDQPENISIAFISAFQGNEKMQEIMDSYPSAERLVYEPEGYEAMNEGLILAVNDNTKVEMVHVDGWDEKTASLKLGEVVFERSLNQGQALIIRYFENETIPPSILRISNEDSGKQMLFDLGYDGSGMYTDEHGITRYLGFYQKQEDIGETEDSLYRFAEGIRQYTEEVYQHTKEK